MWRVKPCIAARNPCFVLFRISPNSETVGTGSVNQPKFRLVLSGMMESSMQPDLHLHTHRNRGQDRIVLSRMTSWGTTPICPIPEWSVLTSIMVTTVNRLQPNNNSNQLCDITHNWLIRYKFTRYMSSQKRIDDGVFRCFLKVEIFRCYLHWKIDIVRCISIDIHSSMEEKQPPFRGKDSVISQVFGLYTPNY